MTSKSSSVITILKIYVPGSKASKYMKQKLIKFQEEIDKSINESYISITYLNN